ncbi:MAG: RNA polymerase sigma factor RpoD/SigA [archaeon]
MPPKYAITEASERKTDVLSLGAFIGDLYRHHQDRGLRLGPQDIMDVTPLKGHNLASLETAQVIAKARGRDPGALYSERDTLLMLGRPDPDSSYIPSQVSKLFGADNDSAATIIRKYGQDGSIDGLALAALYDEAFPGRLPASDIGKSDRGRPAESLNDLLQLYFGDIAGTAPVSADREKELAARIRDGDPEARRELIEANLSFVISVARQYRNRNLSLQELISAGNVGLITAADRFDGNRGYKFISYAVWWIRQSILQMLSEEARAVRLPMNKIGLLTKINKVSQTVMQDEGDMLTSDAGKAELAARLGVSEADITDTLLAAQPTASLDAPPENDLSALETIPAEGESPDAAIMRAQGQEQIERVLSVCDGREQRILSLYLGLDGEKPMTLEQIGALMGLTRERIRQLKKRGLDKIRRHNDYYQL